MPAVLILDGAVVHELAVLAARRHHRNLALEIDERFEHRFLTPDRAPGLGQLIARADQKLALAVVTERGCLQHRGKPSSATAWSRSCGVCTSR